MRRRLSHSSLPLPSSGFILKRTPNFSDTSLKGASRYSENVEPVKSRWSSLKTRSIFGIVMIIGLYLIMITGPIAIIAFIAAIQTLVFKEVISIGHARSIERKLPWFRSISW